MYPCFSTERTALPPQTRRASLYFFISLNIKTALHIAYKGHVEKCGGESELQDSKREKCQTLEVASEDLCLRMLSDLVRGAREETLVLYGHAL